MMTPRPNRKLRITPPERDYDGQRSSEWMEVARQWYAVGREVQCEACRWTSPYATVTPRHPFGMLQLHHIVPISAGGHNQVENLLLLCPNCHRTAHRIFGIRNTRLTKQNYLNRLRDVVGTLATPAHMVEVALNSYTVEEGAA